MEHDSPLTIRPLRDRDYDDFIRITLDAYPGMGMTFERDRDKIREKIDDRLKGGRVQFYGAFRVDRLVGAMRLHDYTMNFRGAMVKAVGLGGVAVDLTCKREHVAGDMIRYYLDLCLEEKALVAVLWPFRPDFYRKIGFGYMGKKFRYSVPPEALPIDGYRKRVAHLQEDDYAALARCYGRIFASGHGMIDETEATLRSTIGASTGGRAVVYRDKEEIRGFLIYRFKRAHGDSFVANDLHVEECLYESPEALAGLLGFLHSQRDQVGRVILELPDPDFHYVPVDPRNGTGNLYPSVYHECASAAVGPMGMIVDSSQLFGSNPSAVYGEGELTVEFAVKDAWWGKAGGAYRVAFSDRKSGPFTGEPQVRLEIGLANFSSLIMGAIRLSRLVEYRLADISDPAQIQALDRILATPRPPFCVTRF